MKKLGRFVILCLMAAMLSACAESIDGEDDEILTVEAESLAEEVPADQDGADRAEPAEDDEVEDYDAKPEGNDRTKPEAGAEGDKNAKESQGGAADAGKSVSESPGAAEAKAGEEGGDTAAEADPWVGEYNDYDTDDPNLEIEKNEDGSYRICIGIFRLASFNDGHGVLTEKGLEFTATAPDGNPTGGIITLDGDVATVTFDPDWSGFVTVFSFKYHKTSDTPDFESFLGPV